MPSLFERADRFVTLAGGALPAAAHRQGGEAQVLHKVNSRTISVVSFVAQAL
jgi:hypothetical protein